MAYRAIYWVYVMFKHKGGFLFVSQKAWLAAESDPEQIYVNIT